MEVKIIDVWEDTVLVDSSIGTFRGIWCSSYPQVSKTYIVELDIDEVITLEAINCANTLIPCIKCEDNQTIIVGFVEDVQDDVMFLRLQKSIMMFEIAPSLEFAQYTGSYVQIRIGTIKIYDTGIY